MIKRTLAAVIRLATGVRKQPASTLPDGPVIYFANHTSHLDFLSIWAALPPTIREHTRPIAAKDYWNKSPLHRWIAASVFQAHLIDRNTSARTDNPLEPLKQILNKGNSIIIFPEGTRSRYGSPNKFKSGIYHLTKNNPKIPLIPVYLENMNRILPAGEFLPIPLLGQIEFRPPIKLIDGETKNNFLLRAQQSVQHDDQ